MKYISYYNSPLGKLTLISDGKYLTNLLINKEITNIEENDNLEIFKSTKDWLTNYFNGKKISIKNLPIKQEGSKFRRLVWEYLSNIPYGTVVTYGLVAKHISELTGKKPCSQAIGGAVGHNTIPIIIPCHRVVGANKNLTGYTGGLDIKIKLLELEGIDISDYTMPRK